MVGTVEKVVHVATAHLNGSFVVVAGSWRVCGGQGMQGWLAFEEKKGETYRASRNKTQVPPARTSRGEGSQTRRQDEGEQRATSLGGERGENTERYERHETETERETSRETSRGTKGQRNEGRMWGRVGQAEVRQDRTCGILENSESFSNILDLPARV